MKKALKILKNIATILGIILMVFIISGIFIWGINFENIEYGADENVSSRNLNDEGPFIFEKERIFEIKYIKGDYKNGYFIENKKQNINDTFNINCFYYPDGTSFSFKIKENKIEKFEYENQEKIITISDIESNYKTFRNFLIQNEVIDKNLNWTFGNGHLVLIGDFIDRSYFTMQVLWFIYKLEQEAEKFGGKVHYILGNHEIMNMRGQNKYAKRKYQNAASLIGIKEFQIYDTTTHLGKWLKTKNVIEKIGSYIFVHGGLSPKFVKNKIEISEINKIARENYYKIYAPKAEFSMEEKLINSSKTSPYWYRGYFKKNLEQKTINKILKFYECSNIIVGHTIQNKINRKYDGKIIAIDVEHPKDYYKYFPEKNTEGLLIENGIFYKIDDKKNKILI